MDKAKILEDLFESDTTKHTFELGKYKITVKNLDYTSQYHLEGDLKKLRENKATDRQFVQRYAYSLLSKTLINWNGKKFDSWDEWEGFLQGKSVALLDKAVKEQQKLEKAIKEACEVENIDDVFSKGDEPADAPEPSQKASTSEEKAQ
jgi:hypothetical protein